jgi:poly(glycerol-phosphate) alpha-glucosyltransferase
MLLPRLDARGLGLTESVAARARLFERTGLRTVVFVTAPQKGLEAAVEELRGAGLLPASTTVKSFFHGDVTSSEAGSAGKAHSDRVEDGLHAVPDAENPDEVVRYFAPDGTPRKYKRFVGNRVAFIDHWDDAMHRTRREEFSASGILTRVQRFDEVTNRAYVEELRRPDGSIHTLVRIDEETGSASEIIAHGPRPTVVENLNQAKAAWLDEELASLLSPVLFSEHRVDCDPLMLMVRSPVRRVAVLHNNHYNAPYDGSTGVRSSFQELFAANADLDAVMVLTPEQYGDLTSEFPDVPFRLVPPAYSDLLPDAPAQAGAATVVSPVPLQKRYGVAQCVRAFRVVVDALPAARLELYGDGPEEDSLRALIAELDLAEAVTLAPTGAYDHAAAARAACLLVASNNEGLFQPMVDAVALGVPVVAQGARYGPRDVIGAPLDGCITSGRGPKEIGRCLLSVLTDGDRSAKARTRAIDARRRLSRAAHEDGWMAALA